MELSKELLEQARATKSPEELLSLAKENRVELNEEEAAAYFAEMHKSGELSDEELDGVSGGGCHKKDGRLVVTIWYGCDEFVCSYCGRNHTETHAHSIPQSNGTVQRSYFPPNCHYCKYISYEGGLWLCNNPSKIK